MLGLHADVCCATRCATFVARRFHCITWTSLHGRRCNENVACNEIVQQRCSNVAATLQQQCVVGLSTHQRNLGVETRFLGIIACNVAARNLHVGLTCNVACNYSMKSSSRLRDFFDVSRVRPRNAAATLLQRCCNVKR